MEEYIKTALKRAKDLYEKSEVDENVNEAGQWRKNAQFALESALRLSLINLNITPTGFVVNFSDATPGGNEVFLNGKSLNTSIEGLYEMPKDRLQRIAAGGDMLMNETEFKK